MDKHLFRDDWIYDLNDRIKEDRSDSDHDSASENDDEEPDDSDADDKIPITRKKRNNIEHFGSLLYPFKGCDKEGSDGETSRLTEH